ncbi:MAG TPA: glycosyltransferase [bacterium]|nr:glycosyltransferase [bacterium]
MRINPKISFLLPVYNSSEYIVTVVESVLQQNYENKKLEIILVDDCSNDDSLQKIEDLKSEYSEIIQIVKHKNNRGLAAARNSAIQVAQGEIYIFLDSDIAPAIDFLDRTLEIFKHSEIQGVVGKTLPAEGIKYDKFQKYLYEARRGARHLKECQPVPYQHFLYNITAVRAEAVRETGLFDTNIKEYGGEDTEYALRMARNFPEGLYFCPQLKGYHHHYRTLDKALDLYEIYGRENVPYLINKYPEMGKLYYYKYLKGPFFLRLIGQIVKSKPFRTLTKMIYKIMPAPLCYGAIRLLLASALLKGMAEKMDD